MRFGAKAAVAMGILLPTLETYRRGLGEWRADFTTMFEDYLAGALLLVGAWVASRRPLGVLVLLVAWAWVTGMMTTSCVDQIEATIRGVDLEPRNMDVLIAKLFLFALSVAGLTATFRDAAQGMAPHECES
jgi:hypothetical protein